jgi:single-strand DNA-binding protein
MSDSVNKLWTKDKAILYNVQTQKKMNTLRNKVSLIGRLGAQPEVVTLDSGRTLARFSLATNENYKNKEGEWQENTQWHNITVWGKTAERASKILNKGQEIVVEGKIVNNSYETKDGEKRYNTTIEVNEFLIISPKAEEVK